MSAMSKYKWARHGADVLYEVGILEDGTLHNPRGYPDEIVREAVLAADARRRERRSNGAKKAAATRHRRQEKRVIQTAKGIIEGSATGPSRACFICGRGLDDPESIQRGIGSECWQAVLVVVEKCKEAAAA
jgi:Family of unknown function (DUF6011)